jgi:hypothetical protein
MTGPPWPRGRPDPPLPGVVRRPREAFGWLEARFLHDRILADLGPEASAVLLLLALAADSKGASYYSRARMATYLNLAPEAVQKALEQLLEWRLVAFRPWQPERKEGVWQLLPLPEKPTIPRGQTSSAATILKAMHPGLWEPGPSCRRNRAD